MLPHIGYVGHHSKVKARMCQQCNRETLCAGRVDGLSRYDTYTETCKEIKNRASRRCNSSKGTEITSTLCSLKRSQEVGANEGSVGEWTNEENNIETNNATLLNLQNGENPVICDNLHQPGGHRVSEINRTQTNVAWSFHWDAESKMHHTNKDKGKYTEMESRTVVSRAALVEEWGDVGWRSLKT